MIPALQQQKIRIFQSTFPLQGTTLWKLSLWSADRYFNPRSHCRERLLLVPESQKMENFNPRSHCRERPCRWWCLLMLHTISIHVPIAGNDATKANPNPEPKHFNPRSHCRERPWKAMDYHFCFTFQSTFPLQGTTMEKRAVWIIWKISIHVPIAGNDLILHEYTQI